MIYYFLASWFINIHIGNSEIETILIIIRLTGAMVDANRMMWMRIYI